MQRRYQWVTPIVLIVIAAVVPFILSELRKSPVPEVLGTIPLVKTMKNAEARDIISRMHGMDVAAGRTVIGVYERGRRHAVLYKTTFDDGTAASAALGKMREKIERGNDVFSQPERFVHRGTELSMCVGLGQRHTFFVRDDAVYWLASDPSIADETLRDLMAWLR